VRSKLKVLVVLRSYSLVFSVVGFAKSVKDPVDQSFWRTAHA
jgi:hypothetical protein